MEAVTAEEAVLVVAAATLALRLRPPVPPAPPAATPEATSPAA